MSKNSLNDTDMHEGMKDKLTNLVGASGVCGKKWNE